MLIIWASLIQNVNFPFTFSELFIINLISSEVGVVKEPSFSKILQNKIISRQLTFHTNTFFDAIIKCAFATVGGHIFPLSTWLKTPKMCNWTIIVLFHWKCLQDWTFVRTVVFYPNCFGRVVNNKHHCIIQIGINW